jgi:hypothetical protein
MKKGGDSNAPITSKRSYKRMSLIIPPELHRDFKTACAAEGMEMSEVLIEFIRRYVAEHAPIIRPNKKGGRQ